MRMILLATMILLLCSCHGTGLGRGDAVRLYFGLSAKEESIPRQEFYRFLDNSVVPRFPAGLTVYEAHGRWREGDGRVTAEESMVVELIGVDCRGSREKLDAIAAEYKSRFRQETVLVTCQETGYAFR